MTDLEQRLQRLAESLPAVASDSERVRRRASHLRRRRRTLNAVSALGAVVIIAVAAPAVIDILPRRGGVLLTPGEPAPPAGWVRRTGVRATFDHPEHWQSLTLPEDRPTYDLISTHGLSLHDLEVARFVASGVRFSADFPRAAVVFVVGGDTGAAPPEPAGAFGEPQPLPLPRGFTSPILVRRGRIAESTHHITAYIGPDAAAEDIRALNAIAASARPNAQPAPDPDFTPPPPGFVPMDAAAAEDLEGRLTRTGLEVTLDDDEIVSLHSGDGCVALRHELPAERLDSSWLQPVCDTSSVPPEPLIVRHETLVMLKTSPPLPSVSEERLDWRVMVLRTSPAYDAVAVQLSDGQLVHGVAADGYGLVAFQGRAAEVIGYENGVEQTRKVAT